MLKYKINCIVVDKNKAKKERNEKRRYFSYNNNLIQHNGNNAITSLCANIRREYEITAGEEVFYFD